MTCSWLSEGKIIAIPKEQEAGMVTADACGRQGVSSASFCRWKARFGGLEVWRRSGFGNWRARRPG
jgi:putative transposase